MAKWLSGRLRTTWLWVRVQMQSTTGVFRKKYSEIHNILGTYRNKIKLNDKASGDIIEKKITYKLKHIESARFMPDTLSNIVDNLAEGDNKKQCKECIDKCLKCIEESPKTKYTVYKSYLEYAEIKDKILQFECITFNKNQEKKFNEDLKKQFANTYKLCNIER